MFNEMKQFLSFVIKEAKHILRDKRTMLILFGMPVVLMFIFGFAICCADVHLWFRYYYRRQERSDCGGYFADGSSHAAGR